eukprot:gene7496-7706_t
MSFQMLTVRLTVWTLGYRLGKGESMQQIIESMQGAVAEGVQTTKAAKRLADKLGVSTPIIQGLYRLLFEGEDPDDMVSSLLCLPLTPELDGSVFSFENGQWPEKAVE